MKKKTIRTGIVGSGFSATFHFDALEKVHGTNVEVVGVYSKDPAQAAAYAQKRGIRFFESLEALLDEVDVIHVCTPPVSHEPISVAGLPRDKFVVCEKPLTGYFGDGSPDFHWDRADKQIALRLRPGQRGANPRGRAHRARAGCSTPRTGSTPRRCRRSGKSWRRPAARSSGSTARRPTAARTRWTTPTRPAAAAAC